MAKKIRCKLCGARITDCFRSKWRHATTRHPEIIINKIVPLIVSPEIAHDLGAEFGSWLRSRLNA